ncbi:MAG: shikimate dehydrogenase, partial [Lachnospiraceae bacterium]|nr:shikimate dehydrogenase [Lachnospiraceae bacterium]
KLCGLIGNPVGHTLSPVIHHHLASLCGHHLEYRPMQVEADELKTMVRNTVAGHMAGCNVTVPYKSAVIQYLDRLDPVAEGIGAVNTIVPTPEGLTGFNTDMPGLLRAMTEDGVSIKGEHVIILGAGGVARAVAFLMLREGAAQVYILNRTVEKAESIVQEMRRVTGHTNILAMSMEEYGNLPRNYKYLAIQATSVGLYPDTEKTVVEDASFYERIHTGYDLIYTPADTKFMQLVKAHGGQAYNGLKMLLYQAIIAYELWHDVQITSEMAKQTYQVLADAVERRKR